MSDEKKTFGENLGYLNHKSLKGKLIVLEGTDGVGRSTQMELLRNWLEVQGHGVVTTGWTKSTLMKNSIELVKKGQMTDFRTFSLLYATDFADRFENQIIPALKSGFIVLADRYVYTAWARDYVRRKSMDWIKSLLSFGLVPDLVLYLKVDIETLVPRAIESGGMNYWESGMDLNLADNLYDSFKEYQSRLIDCYNEISKTEAFETIDATKSVDNIFTHVQQKVTDLLGSERSES